MAQVDRSILKEIVPQFHQFLEVEGRQWQEERKEKDEFFAVYFTEDQIDELEEGTLRELIHILWVFNAWTNKDWLLQEMLHSGLPTIKRSFKQLLYGDGPVASRFDSVRERVRMMGAASVSEVLAHYT